MANDLPASRDERRRSEGGLGDTLKVVAQALLIALVVRVFLFQPFNIPSGSLIPTLLVGDYLFASKYTYGYSKHSLPFSLPLFEGRVFASTPQRGDIAVFKLPRDGSTDYIKRVIGLPGDRIQMVDGVLHIGRARPDGTVEPLRPLRRERLPDYRTLDAFARPVGVPAYRETNPEGRSYTVIERDGDRGFFDNTAVYTVPAGHYFMMGDNRDNSTDSRSPEVGTVPFENFVGRAEIIFFSIDEFSSAWRVWEWPWTVRWNRIFQTIR